uniref:RFX-type winged-helix domain-containing protein n=1 Tax=Anolis carolinensis TaxID=28377 RepID=A0A803SWQ8_ANOCA|nr:PREDICTED: DNA-binding protein RFX5 [Anolis carolinensis]|eukprot:XP_003229075.1 PREDICTED: DNA-binding protein RFX5 [Anolis carolinensis]
MADENSLDLKIEENESDCFEVDPQSGAAEPSTLLQKLKGAISKSVQNKVNSILQDVQRFSDHAKLYLYLQLPSGPSSGEKSLDLTSLSSAEHMHACTWIQNHLEEYPDTCLPKQDVYDAYKRYCDNLCCRSLSAANFGKIMREIFPNIKARRLGGRGQSKYCYSGIRRKTVVNMPPLPSLDLKETEMPERTEVVQSYNDEVMDAACALTCDWAEKILKRSFNNIVEVAQFLIQQHIISSRSAHADLVMAMVVSETSESHRDKRPLQTMKTSEPEVPENAAKAQPQTKLENSPKPSAPPLQNEAKKPTEAPAKPPSRPQVNVTVVRRPPLLPRVQVHPGDRLMVSSGGTAMHLSPPLLAPKLTTAPVRGTVKMALSVGSPSPMLLAPAVNGPASLVGPQGAVPVINMMPVINVAVPPSVAEILPKPKVTSGGSGVNGCETRKSPCEPPKAKPPCKRPAETCGEAAVKRKRGRPRKRPDEPEPSLPEKRDDAEKEGSDIIVVRVGYEDQAASPSPCKNPPEENLPVEVARGDDPKPTADVSPSVAGGHIVCPPSKPAVLPTKVSVIKGRGPLPPILVRETGSGLPEPLRLGKDSGPKVIVGKELDEPEQHCPLDLELQPTDLSMGKARSLSARDTAQGLRASAVRLHCVGTERETEAETMSSSTSTQAPSR